MLGPSGLREDDAAARLIAGLEEPTAGRVLIGGQRRHRLAPGRAERRDGLPELRAVPAPDRGAEHRASGSTCATCRRREARGAGPRRRPSWSAAPSCSHGGRTSSRAASVSASRSPARSSASRTSSCSTSRSRTSTRELRVQVRAELKELQRRVGGTMVHVTHDQVEALVARRPGRRAATRASCSRSGAPDEVWAAPREPLRRDGSSARRR